MSASITRKVEMDTASTLPPLCVLVGQAVMFTGSGFRIGRHVAENRVLLSRLWIRDAECSTPLPAGCLCHAIVAMPGLTRPDGARMRTTNRFQVFNAVDDPTKDVNHTAAAVVGTNEHHSVSDAQLVNNVWQHVYDAFAIPADFPTELFECSGALISSGCKCCNYVFSCSLHSWSLSGANRQLALALRFSGTNTALFSSRFFLCAPRSCSLSYYGLVVMTLLPIQTVLQGSWYPSSCCSENMQEPHCPLSACHPGIEG